MKFIYLVQSDGRPLPYEFPERSDHLHLQWQPEFRPENGGFHFPGSSWAEGRNELFRRARLIDDYDYYVFLDDDVSFEMPHSKGLVGRQFRRHLRYGQWLSAIDMLRSRAWQPLSFSDFEQTLTAHGSMVAAPNLYRHGWGRASGYRRAAAVAYTDHCMIAVHRSVAADLLPYATRFDRLNWWAASEEFSERAARLCWGRMHLFPDRFVSNLESRDYPRGADELFIPNNVTGKAVVEPLPAVATDETEMSSETAIVVTTISPPTEALRRLADGARRTGSALIAVADRKTPADFDLKGCDLLTMDDQAGSQFRLAASLPENHYCRKNIGHLTAMARPETRFIVETDDDNLPRTPFWRRRTLDVRAEAIATPGWWNIYRRFTNRHVWPRGFPLERIGAPEKHPAAGEADRPEIPASDQRCLVQQGLADVDPDVDAVYRMTSNEPVYFRDADPVFLSEGVWCPFNSQNTSWAVEAAQLMYLPAHCSMRETDILRGYIAQRILWTLGSGVLFHGATMAQDRNPHEVAADYRAEQRLYLHAAAIADLLMALPLRAGYDAIGGNMRLCYEALIRFGMLPQQELTLLESWLADVAEARHTAET